VARFLIDLFHQAIGGHRREAPALADISMARASERFEPRLVTHFSNGDTVLR
jgi:hypothetical protein